MTLTIIFGVAILAGISLKIWDSNRDKYSDGIWVDMFGFILIIISTIALLINMACWIPHKKDNQILLQQLNQEKQIIEQILDSGADLDKIMIRQDIINYNNKIIEIKINSKRFILKDYYDKNIDWDAFELIEWKN